MQAGRAEVRAVTRARRPPPRATSGPATVFFLDEIHRFNKAQQDALLPAVEEGLVTLIGATTENPAFEVNGALLSRVRVYALQALTRGGGGDGAAPCGGWRGRSRRATPGRRLDEEAIDFLAARSEGDARSALNALELALATAAELGRGARRTIARAEDALQRVAVLYDKGGDRHYDYISAWIKATRGSDPDASLYYLAVMLEGGEDPRFIVRRMVILASEDIGNADPRRWRGGRGRRRRSSTWGCPRPNSRSRRRRSTSRSRRSRTPPDGRSAAAQRHVREHGAAPVPGWLRSGPRPRPDGAGGRRLRQPPRASRGTSRQELAPESVAGERFYEPDEAEAELARRLARSATRGRSTRGCVERDQIAGDGAPQANAGDYEAVAPATPPTQAQR